MGTRLFLTKVRTLLDDSKSLNPTLISGSNEADIENWPICDFLISFFSDGFPIDKASRLVLSSLDDDRLMHIIGSWLR